MFISGDRGLLIFNWLCLFLVKAGNEILRMVIKQMIIDTEHNDKMAIAMTINSKWWLEAFVIGCLGTLLTLLMTAFTSLAVAFIISLFNFTLENWNPPISPNPLRDILTRAPVFGWTISSPLIWSLVVLLTLGSVFTCIGYCPMGRDYNISYIFLRIPLTWHL